MTLDTAIRRILLDPLVSDVRGAVLRVIPPAVSNADAARLAETHHRLLHVASGATDPDIAARATVAAATVYSMISAGRFQSPEQRSIRSVPRRYGMKATADLGFWNPLTDMDYLATYKAAAYQIAQATAGNRIADPRQAEYRETVLSPPVDVPRAMARVAFWMGVLSRMGLPGFTSPAASWLAGSQARMGLTFVSSTPADVRAKLTEGATEIRRLAGARVTDWGVRYILGLLGAVDSGMVAGAQKTHAEATPGAVIAGTLSASGADAVKIVQTGRGLVTGEKPPGTTDLAWFFQKWGWRIGLGAVLLGTIMWLGKPYLAAWQRGSTKTP